MSTVTNPVFDAALALPESQRVELAERLLESLDSEKPIVLSEAWRVELHRRLADYQCGKDRAMPVEDVIARVRESLR
ncbi:MAG: hypothetical protein EXS05_05185 [Planctomycetaceae bacterium]|nr:hypothetical protein [Planctomycetaceae bacterium]